MTARQIKVVRQRLQDHVEEFAAESGRSERGYWCGKYLEGLPREGGRKSIKPLPPERPRRGHRRSECREPIQGVG